MKRDTVSVVIPCHNAHPWLGETLASILAQTHPPVEVLVVDDGSTDGSAALAEAMGPPVRVIRQANAGVAAARNRGVSEANGEWVAFCDADDLWHPEKLGRQIACSAEGFDLVYCDAEYFGAARALPRNRSSFAHLPQGRCFEALLRGNVVTTSGVLIRRHRLAGLTPFQAALSPAEDWAVWLEAASRMDLGCVREELVRYRVHPGGISRNVERFLAGCLGVLAWARTLPVTPSVPRATWRAAEAAVLADAALRYELAGQPGPARRLHAAVLRRQPLRIARWKALARNCLPPRAPHTPHLKEGPSPC